MALHTAIVHETKCTVFTQLFKGALSFPENVLANCLHVTIGPIVTIVTTLPQTQRSYAAFAALVTAHCQSQRMQSQDGDGTSSRVGYYAWIFVLCFPGWQCSKDHQRFLTFIMKARSKEDLIYMLIIVAKFWSCDVKFRMFPFFSDSKNRKLAALVLAIKIRSLLEFCRYGRWLKTCFNTYYSLNKAETEQSI